MPVLGAATSHKHLTSMLMSIAVVSPDFLAYRGHPEAPGFRMATAIFALEDNKQGIQTFRNQMQRTQNQLSITIITRCELMIAFS